MFLFHIHPVVILLTASVVSVRPGSRQISGRYSLANCGLYSCIFHKRKKGLGAPFISSGGCQQKGDTYFKNLTKSTVPSIVVPVLDRILQPSTSIILGPVWVTRGGERFSPKGAYHFITTLLLSTKDRLKQSKTYKQQVQSHIALPTPCFTNNSFGL